MAPTRFGGALFLVAAVQFVFAMAVTQYSWAAPYSLSSNSVSDLGAVTCGSWTSYTTRYVCSPWHLVFDFSVVLEGGLVLAGTFLVPTVFGHSVTARWGRALLAASAMGSIGVGLAPQDVNLPVHSLAALAGFIGGAAALMALGRSMQANSRWGARWGLFSITGGSVSALATLFFLSGRWGPFGLGIVERLVISPVLLWLGFVGFRLIWPPRAEQGAKP